MEAFLETTGWQYAYLASVMLFAGTVHGALGLGFPMVATPLIAILFDVRLAILLTLLPTVSVNLATIWGGKDYGRSLRDYYPLLLAALAGSIIGAWMLAVLDPSPFRLVLALLILVYLFATLFDSIRPGWLEPDARMPMLAFGFVSGISAGITNVMVAILIIYFLAIQLDRGRMIPLLNTCFLIGKLSQITILAVAGLVTLELMVYSAPLALAGVAALFLGQVLGRKISVEAYRKALYALLAVLALILLYQFTVDVFAGSGTG